MLNIWSARPYSFTRQSFILTWKRPKWSLCNLQESRLAPQGWIAARTLARALSLQRLVSRCDQKRQFLAIAERCVEQRTRPTVPPNRKLV